MLYYKEEKVCASLFYGWNESYGAFGNTFMIYQYMVFDFELKRFAFGKTSNYTYEEP